MLPKIPFEELIHALEGADSIFKSCPDLIKCYLHPAQVDQIDNLIRLCDLYSTINRFIAAHENEICRYKRSLFKSINEAMKLYKMDVRSLENELDDPCLSLTAFSKLKRFTSIHQDIIQVLEISEKTNPMETLDQIYKKFSSPNPFTREVFEKMYKVASKPLFDDIWYWMIYGYLVDQGKGKFFIEQNDSGEIVLSGSLFPSFLSQSICSKIYFAGKVVRSFTSKGDFLSQIFDDKRAKLLEQYQSIIEKPIFEKLDFELLVEQIRTICAKISIQHVIEEENLLMYLKLIKDFVLAGNEDLLGCFINNLFMTLQKKPANRKKLEKGIMLSLSNTLMDFYSSERLERVSSCINIKLAGTDDHNEWPATIIEFSFPETVKSIIRNDHLIGYNKIFNFCVNLHRAKETLTESWRLLIKNKTKTPIYWFLHHRLILIIGHLYYFYKVNVIERLYFEFISVVESCQDIEVLIETHHQFVVKLVTQSLLDIDAVSMMLNNLFTFISKACSLMDDTLTFKHVEDLEKELGQLCAKLDGLFTSLKSYSICPTLSHLVIQIHKCLGYQSRLI